MQAQSGTTSSGGGSTGNIGTIVAGIVVPVVIIGIGLLLFYIWYRRKYPVRMVIGKDFSKFSNPKYNHRASRLTLVRNDAESAWDIPDSEKQRSHSLSLVKEDEPTVEVENEHTNQEDKETVDTSSVPNNAVKVGAEILPPPPQIARERPRKAKLVKTMDLADDLSESAFGIVTESDLDKRTDSDISSGNDSTETHTISLSFRDTFDGRHRNTVSAVSSLSDTGLSERAEHRANSLPQELKGYPNIPTLNFKESQIRDNNLSKSLDNNLYQAGEVRSLNTEHDKTEFLKVDKESFDSKTDNKPLTETNPFETNDESINQEQSFVIISEEETTQTSTLAGTGNLTLKVSLEEDKLEQTITNDSVVLLNSDLVTGKPGYNETDNISSFENLASDTEINTTQIKALSTNPFDEENGFLPTCTEIEDLQSIRDGNELASKIASGVDYNQIEAAPTVGSDLPTNSPEINGCDASENVQSPEQSKVSEIQFPELTTVILQNADSASKESNSLKSSESIALDSSVFQSVTSDIGDNSRILDVDDNAKDVLSEPDAHFMNVQETEDLGYKEPITSVLEEAESIKDRDSPEIGTNNEENYSLSGDRRTSLTIKKENLFLDAPPTPMIIVRDSYIYEPETVSPLLLDIKNGDNGMSVIKENAESQASTRSNSFDFDVWENSGNSETSVSGKSPEVKLQENSSSDGHNVKTEPETFSVKVDNGENKENEYVKNIQEENNMYSLGSFAKNENGRNIFDSGNTIVLEGTQLSDNSEIVPELNNLGNSVLENAEMHNDQIGVSDFSTGDLLFTSLIPDTPTSVQSDSTLESASTGAVQGTQIGLTDTWVGNESFSSFGVDVGIPETTSQLLNFDVLEHTNTVKDEENNSALLISPMTISTDSSALSWELIDELLPGSRENDSFQPGKENDSREHETNLKVQQDGQRFQLLDITDFATERSISSEEERKQSDSSSSREADTSWDLIDEPVNKIDALNLADIDKDNDTSTA